MTEEEAQERAASTLMHMLAAFRNAECGSCEEKVGPMDEVYFDRLASALDKTTEILHCPGCAINLRYHRKRALMRDEEMPLSFQDVDQRLAQR